MQIVNTEEWTNKIKEKFDGKKYFIYTLGCQLNENDSEKIAGMLSAAGISKTDKEADAQATPAGKKSMLEKAALASGKTESLNADSAAVSAVHKSKPGSAFDGDNELF